MSVVNVKVAHIRPKYKNLADWCSDKDNVYIGRKGVVFIDGQRYPKKDSIWANPFRIRKDDPDHSREKVLDLYRDYIYRSPELLSQLHTLQGKTLGCWCHPEPCHGDIILELIETLC